MRTLTGSCSRCGARWSNLPSICGSSAVAPLVARHERGRVRYRRTRPREDRYAWLGCHINSSLTERVDILRSCRARGAARVPTLVGRRPTQSVAWRRVSQQQGRHIEWYDSDSASASAGPCWDCRRLSRRPARTRAISIQSCGLALALHFASVRLLVLFPSWQGRRRARPHQRQIACTASTTRCAVGVT